MKRCRFHMACISFYKINILLGKRFSRIGSTRVFIFFIFYFVESLKNVSRQCRNHSPCSVSYTNLYFLHQTRIKISNKNMDTQKQLDLACFTQHISVFLKQLFGSQYAFLFLSLEPSYSMPIQFLYPASLTICSMRW